METKKKLRKDLNALQSIFMKEIGSHKLQINELLERIEALENKQKEVSDIITGAEAAKMLGWQSGYVSSTWLDKIGVRYSKGDNGCLKISKKDIEDYLTIKTKTNED